MEQLPGKSTLVADRLRARLRPAVVGLSVALVYVAAGCSNALPGDAVAAESALSARPGDEQFRRAFPHTNGRTCASCHVLEEHTALSPAHVQKLMAESPNDPLFNRIDADDPTAATPTYEHLQKGLVRVVLPLADNLDVIDAQGRVITPADRKIFVWRGVPTVENTALSGPYQYDGREATLAAQAQGAITNHSQGGVIPQAQLDRIADFERSLFSSERARFVAQQLEGGVPLQDIPDPEAFMPLSDSERRGRDVYQVACESCHGGPTKDRILNRPVHDGLFLAVSAEGNVQFALAPNQPPAPIRVARPHDEFLNVGFSVFSYLGQRGQFPTFNASVALPQYRLRFYSDGTRTQKVTDLPPIPVTASGDPFDLVPALDANGAPIVGPNLLPQWFSTDPGRAIITGDPANFEAFDMPQLRGIAQTAPYFHDNSHATLTDVVDSYSRFVLGGLPALGLPPVNPPEGPFLPPESLTPAQKRDLLAFLNRL